MKKPRIASMGLEDYRCLLLAKKADLLRNAAAGRTELAAGGRLSPDDEAPVQHDRYISIEVKRLDHEILGRIDAALARLANGDFGICAECGNPISPKRLQALPWADCCIRCQERAAADPQAATA